ncbi:MAG: GTP-binding protein [Spirochaetales bacterium]|uniref:GTP-binding protein n=1 Tax=Candidatus Thalassospirochaeta sargassi TaxID=3119039 RepID=A0AAJ1IC88_9SPIO|nr:GTP-binding protein [Spirochaetales bacterium]
MSVGIPLVLVSGFLGAGKTTFLNSIFDNFPDRRFGIIVNDFGDLGVDAAEINAADGRHVSELNNGQIFCSCLSGSFINSVTDYADLDIDYLLVEASGLAKPSPLMDIINGIKQINGDKFRYYGMISLVDAGSYLELSEVLTAVDEQIAYSDLVLVNKADTADAGRLAKTEMKILSVNPEAEVVRTKYGRISPELFLGLKEKIVLPRADRRFAGWGSQGRPVPLLFKSEGSLERSELEAFIKSPGGEFYRMKGRLDTTDGEVFVDCTVNSLELRNETGKTGVEKGLVIILPADDNVINSVKKRAKALFESVV